MEEFGAVLGLQFQSLRQLADRILECPPGGRHPAELFEIEARRALAAEPTVAAVLGAFDDGLAAALSSVGDLLSAGLESSSVEDMSKDVNDPLAQGVVRAAGATLDAVRSQRIALSSETMRLATQRLRERSPDVLRAEAVLLVGINDAPGRTRAFVASVLEHAEARLFLDRPPPSGAFPQARSDVLPERFARRLAVAVPESSSPPSSHPSHIRGFDAVGRRGEVIEVARRIEDLLARGCLPEDILVTARDLEAYGPDLQEEFLDRGIPFSGGRLSAAFDPRYWRRMAVVQLAHEAGAAPLARTLPWVGAGLEDGLLGDLDLACRHLGLSRLEDLADLDVAAVLGSRDSYALPWRPRVGRREEEADDADPSEENAESLPSARRHLPRSVLEDAAQRAQKLRDLVAQWPDEGEAAEHARRLMQLGEPDDASSEVLMDWVQSMSGDDLPGYVLTRAEFLRLAASCWTDHLESDLGGRGGGVQVLPIAQARTLACSQAFILGLERGSIPQVGSEDPLLSDRHRKHLQRWLPDLGLSERRMEEEHHLFASLLAAAPDVTLSWRRADEDGAPVSPSPFVRALVTEGMEVAHCPAEASGRVRRDQLLGRTLDPRDGAIAMALNGPSESLTRMLAIEETIRRDAWSLGPTAETAERLARAWTETLRYVVSPVGVHPWMGWIGPLQAGDPRAERLFVTRLESYAACPWSHFIMSLLDVAPAPDAAAALPAVDPLLLGNAVHGAMEHLARSVGAPSEGSLEGIVAGRPVPLPAPDAHEVRAAVLEASKSAASQAGLVLPGFVRALALQALPSVRILLDLLHRTPPLTGLLGVETRGTVDADGVDIGPLHFRADAVGVRGTTLVLDDFKTGAAFTKAKTESTRRKHIMKALRRGLRLQALAYVRAASELGVDAEGRYLFGKDDGGEYERILGFCSDDVEAFQLFDEVVRTLKRAREAGVFFARVEDPEGKNPSVCNVCECRMACFKDETLERARLVATAERLRKATDDAAKSSAEALHRAMWFLGDSEGTS